jgi:two-component sensor histidine kinase
MIVSLLSLQSRGSANAEAGSQLAIAANRVAAIARLHRRLHYLDGVQTVGFKQYLEDICRDFGMMLGAEARQEQVISVEAIEIMLPTKTGIPLGFIVNELLTNAAKYGTGRIMVRLQPNPGNGFALSVSNDGLALPEKFDLTAQQGLGMRIVRSFVESIGGDLRISRGDENKGARFTVLFH